MALAELTLFGGFELQRSGGEVIDLPGQKERALLAVLALRPGANQSRDKLAGLLWGDRGDKQARDSLKHSVTRLRQSLESITPPPVVADRQSVRLDPATLAIDVAQFEQLLRDGTLEALEQATALYRGDLLEGFTIHDAGFEDWLAAERQRLRHSVEEALTKVMAQSMSAGAKDRAAVAARRLLLLDPLREAACRTLMQIEAERTQTAQALKLYRVLRERLHRELGVKPEPATTQLYESIRLRRAGPELPTVGPLPAEPAPRAEPMPAQLPLPSKPSIAVLPFRNMSGDPNRQYFIDGITEDIITELSRFRQLFVIARNSSFQYRGKDVDVKQVGRELGVRYVVEGSIRSTDTRIRVTVQLIDAGTGNHLWAERYDRDIGALFEVQDEVARSIVATLAGRVEEAEVGGTVHKRTESLPAYECLLRGIEHLRGYGLEDNRLARGFFERAISLDTRFALAHAYLALALLCEHGLADAPDSVKDRAVEVAETAIRLDPNDARCHQFLAWAHMLRREYEPALFHFERSIDLNPNDANGIEHMGTALSFVGRADQGIELIRQAMRLNPFYPDWYWGDLAIAYYAACRYLDSLEASRHIAGLKTYRLLALEAACCAQLGRHGEARATAAEVLRLKPAFRISAVKWAHKNPEDSEHIFEGMRKAGLPE
jgi:TolB-like protein/DNA-binding SARP family transcriptional activator